MTVAIKESKVKRALYKCANCGSEDAYKYFFGDPMNPDLYPQTIPCWSCKNGYNCYGKGTVLGMSFAGTEAQ